jgi:hypothetical protein
MKLTTHLCLLLRLRTSGITPLLPIFVFMVCTGTALFLRVHHLHGNWNRDLFLVQSQHTSCGAQPTLYPMGTVALSLE